MVTQLLSATATATSTRSRSDGGIVAYVLSATGAATRRGSYRQRPGRSIPATSSRPLPPCRQSTLPPVTTASTGRRSPLQLRCPAGDHEPRHPVGRPAYLHLLIMEGQPARRGKSVGEEFVDHRLLSRIGHYPDSNNLPRPLDMVLYFKDEPPCQTIHCTNVAVEQYNGQQQSDDRKIRCAVGVDSNMFILDQNDPISYWHVYFKCYLGKKSKK